MSDFTPGDSFHAPKTRETPQLETPELVAPLLGDTRAARRRSGRLVVAVAALLVVTAAVAVPLMMGQASTVSGAASGVFAQSTVRFSVSASSRSLSRKESTGPDGLRSYSIVVTLRNPTGGPVAEQGVSDTVELSVRHGSTDLGDFLLARGALYLRLDTRAVNQLAGGNGHGAGGSITSTLERASRRHGLRFLKAVVAGDWIGLKESSLEKYAKGFGLSGASNAEASQLRSGLALSFAQAWDAWQSTHVVSASGGVTEYSVSLPVRDFLGKFLADLEGQLGKSVPAATELEPVLRRAIDQIPRSLSIPVHMWVAHGSLVKVAVSYHGSSVTVGITHPRAGAVAPSAPTMLTIANVRTFAHWVASEALAGIVSVSGSGTASIGSGGSSSSSYSGTTASS